jgi:regulator of protease activity HflC (stomatin/prohibitin superfamily)
MKKANNHRRISRLRHWLAQRQRDVLILVFVAMVALTMLYPMVVTFIPAGHGGVLWKRFDGGTQLIPAIPEGLFIHLPWDRVTIYDLRLQEHTKTYETIANDGLVINLELTFRYRLIPEYLGYFHKIVGPDYVQNLLMPDIAASLREIASRYKSDEIYAMRRHLIQAEIFDQLEDFLMYFGVVEANQPHPINYKDEFINGFVFIQDVLLGRIDLPEPVMQAIERKAQQDQLAQQYQFRLERENMEAERKRIEGDALRRFQQKVNENMTENYLRWRGIEAALELSRSPATRLVAVGGGSSGIPIMLNWSDLNEGQIDFEHSLVKQPVNNARETLDMNADAPPPARDKETTSGEHRASGLVSGEGQTHQAGPTP